MARNFNGTNDYLLDSSVAVVSGPPATLVCFARRESTTGERTLISCANNSEGNPLFRLEIVSSGAQNTRIQFRNDNADIVSVEGGTLSGFAHVCGIIEAGTDNIRIFNDGVETNSGTIVDTAITLQNTAIGVLKRATAIQFFDGDLAEVAIWNVALTDAEVVSLSAGVSPSMIRPQSLAFYPPLVRELIDVTGNATLTEQGTGTTAANHPAVIYPSAQILQFPPVAAAAGRIMSSLAYHGGLAGKGGIAGAAGGLAG